MENNQNLERGLDTIAAAILKANSNRQTGWGYTTVASTTNQSSVYVPFPKAYLQPPRVTATVLGWKASGAPTSIDQLTGDYGAGFGVFLFIRNITKDGFTVHINSVAGSFGGGSFNGFSWAADL